MRIDRRSLLAMSAAAAAAAAVAACSRQQSANGLTPFTFLLDWTLEPNYTGFLLAKEKGFFSDRGIDATLEEGSGGATVAQQIGLGNTYVVGSSSGGGTAVARSGGVPIKSTAVIFPRISTVIFSRPERPIRQPSDLIGKRIGLVAGSVTVNEYRALLRAANIDRARITEVGVNSDPTSLLHGDVDALIDYREQLPASLQAQNTPIELMALADHGVTQYGLNIIANEAALADAERGPHIRAASEAAVAGYEYLRGNVGEAIELYMSKYPQKNRAYVQRSIEITAEILGTGPVGAQDAAGWQQTLDSLRSVDLVTPAVTVEQVMG